MARRRVKQRSAISKALNWLGNSGNSRVITTLIAIGALIGGIFVFAIERVVPVIAPEWSATAFGEGYRRGRREMELEFRLRSSEETTRILRQRQKIDEWVRSLTDEQLAEELKKWTRD